MFKNRLNLRNVVAIATCLAGFIFFSIMFSSCNKEEKSIDNPNNPDIPPLINVEKGLGYSEVLENFMANGYVPSEQTDSTIVFKGENLQGIHPLSDFLTGYIIDSSKQVTFAFNEEGLYMLKFEGNADSDDVPNRLSTKYEAVDFDGFIEDTKKFVDEQYESMHVYGISYAYRCWSLQGGQPVGEKRCSNNHIIGDWHLLRLSCNAGNIYPAMWWATRPGMRVDGITIWFLLIPGNNPNTGTITHPDPQVVERIELFECTIQHAINWEVNIICQNKQCWH